MGELLTRDAVGVVRRGRVLATGEQVAIRVAKIGPEAAPWLVEGIVQQWTALASVRHPALVGLRDLEVHGDELTLVTELAAGRDLRRQLTTSGPLPPGVAAGMAADLATALAAIHDAGLAHAAVTAETVLVTAGQPAARLADLATVRLLRPSGVDTDELASSAYAAPELGYTRRRVAATDVYALGIVLYEMLTGSLPYDGGSPAEVLRRHAEEEPTWPLDLPSGLRYVLGRALQPDPANRPWAAAIAADLNEFRKQLSDTPRPARLRRVDPRARRLIAPDENPADPGSPHGSPANPGPSQADRGGAPAPAPPGALPKRVGPDRPAAWPGSPPTKPDAPAAGRTPSAPSTPPPWRGSPEPGPAPAAPPHAPAHAAPPGAPAAPPTHVAPPDLPAPPATPARSDHPPAHAGPAHAADVIRPVAGPRAPDAPAHPPAHAGPAHAGPAHGGSAHSGPAHASTGLQVNTGGHATTGSYAAAVGGGHAAKKTGSRRPVQAIAAVVTALALVIGGVLFFRSLDSSDRPRSASNKPTPGPGRTELDRTSSAAPTLDAAAKARTPEGGAAFVRYWFAALNYAVRTGQVAGLEQVSDRKCVECQRALVAIKENYADGGSLRGGSYTVRSVVPTGLTTGEQLTLDVVFDRSPRSSLGADGDAKDNLAGASFVVTRALTEWTGSGWSLITLAASGPIA